VIAPRDWRQIVVETDDEEVNEIFIMLHNWLAETNKERIDMFEVYRAMTLVGAVNVFHMCGSDIERATDFMNELREIAFIFLSHHGNDGEQPIKH
tara:strand:+ start:498 stop:782 length:285 start_codon:yes stop_codon:yes gene_type:complete